MGKRKISIETRNGPKPPEIWELEKESFLLRNRPQGPLGGQKGSQIKELGKLKG